MSFPCLLLSSSSSLLGQTIHRQATQLNSTQLNTTITTTCTCKYNLMPSRKTTTCQGNLFSCLLLKLFMWSCLISTGRAFSTSTSSRVAAHVRRRLWFHHDNSLPTIQKNFWSDYAHSTTTVYMSSVDEETSTTTTSDKTIESQWNVGGLRKEVTRLTMRAHKKIGKANQRLTKATVEVERLTSDPDVSMEELETCPNLEELQAELTETQDRLKNLNQLEVLLVDVKGKSVVLPEHVAELALQLEVNDEPQKRAARPVKQEKGPRKMESFRLPYRRFYSENKTEIRVGKQAEDNDELSTSPEHRDGADWWMHASGCPGSHIVIRCHDQDLDEQVVQDAAALAARQSKCTGNVIKVSMTRARDVKKPPGSKAGLVMLTGKVRTVVVDMKKAQERLDRLDKTVMIN